MACRYDAHEAIHWSAGSISVAITVHVVDLGHIGHAAAAGAGLGLVRIIRAAVLGVAGAIVVAVLEDADAVALGIHHIVRGAIILVVAGRAGDHPSGAAECQGALPIGHGELPEGRDTGRVARVGIAATGGAQGQGHPVGAVVSVQAAVRPIEVRAFIRGVPLKLYRGLVAAFRQFGECPGALHLVVQHHGAIGHARCAVLHVHVVRHTRAETLGRTAGVAQGYRQVARTRADGEGVVGAADGQLAVECTGAIRDEVVGGVSAHETCKRRVAQDKIVVAKGDPAIRKGQGIRDRLGAAQGEAVGIVQREVGNGSGAIECLRCGACEGQAG